MTATRHRGGRGGGDAGGPSPRHRVFGRSPAGRLARLALALALLAALVALTAAATGDSFRGGRAGGAGGGTDPGDRAMAGDQALLTGRITEAGTGAPLAGATVRIDHAGGPTEVRSGADGRYRAVVVASRPIALTVDAPGYKGGAAFGVVCPGERRELSLALPAAVMTGPPPTPIVLRGECGGTGSSQGVDP